MDVPTHEQIIANAENILNESEFLADVTPLVRESLEGTGNQLNGHRSANRLVFTLGKFGVTDVFLENLVIFLPAFKREREREREREILYDSLREEIVVVNKV